MLLAMHVRHFLFIQGLKKLIAKDPRIFIVRLYSYLAGVFGLYGTARRKSMPAGEYARLVEKKFKAEGINKLVAFTERFNLARYSSHLVDQKMAYSQASEYEDIVRGMIKFHKLRSNFIAYVRLIFKRLPLKLFH